MKRFRVVMLMLLTLAAFILPSCTNELTLPTEKDNNVTLVHTPDVVAWSGEYGNIGSTFNGGIMTRSSNPNSNQWSELGYVVPNSITEEEIETVTEWFSIHQWPTSESIDLEDFFVQHVSGSHSNMDYLVAGNDDHIYNFNASAGQIMLMVNSSTEQFGFHSSQDSQMHYTYVIVCINGAYYVGFDYEATGQNPNQREERDGFYNDWIVKIVPADGSSMTPPVQDPVEGEGTIVHNDEIEVNYAINDIHSDAGEQKYLTADLWTKLSIHVRKATDVKITVPIPSKYFCQSDDLVILEKHRDDLISLPESQVNHVQHYNVNGHEITLTVTLNDNNMTVETTGINQDVIDYLFEQNGDGINFEVWNYYQTETAEWIENVKDIVVTPIEDLSQTELFGYMNQAQIEFLDEVPSYYINAFGFEYENGEATNRQHPYHATVTPVQQWKNVKSGLYHLNGTPYNTIYFYTESPDDAHIH